MNRRLTIAAALFVALTAALGMVAAWPIYRSPNFLIATGVAALIGIGAAYAAARLKWSWWISALVLTVAFLAISFALAVPARWASGDIFPGAVLDVVTGPVTGWKDLITSPLPVGTYRNLLVPAVALFLVVPFAATTIAFAPGSAAMFAVPLAALLPAFGMLFGRAATSSPLRLGDLTLRAPVEIAVGAAGVLLGVVWLAWRAREQRRVALRRAEDHTGVHGARTRRPGAAVRRIAMAAAMIVVAGAVGVAATPALTETRTRDVLRSAIGPDLTATNALSPLATYRQNFLDSAYDSVLFTVASDEDLPARIRIATLDWYDGEVYRTSDDADAAFQRVPSVLSTPPGARSTVSFTIETHTSVWLPTFGALESIDFRGADAAGMADRFYYDAGTGTAVEAGGVITGQSYEVTAVVAEEPALEGAPTVGSSSKITPPQSLRTWVDSLGVARTGDGLLTAITALRDRGYLSHSLTLDEAQPAPKWVSALPGYSFRSSAAGHSVARVDALFTQLLERESQALGQGPDASLVAAVGDDEQFAVAGAMIAEYLGFPARVVVGVRTADDTLPACAEGVCTGADVTAWIEVGTADGRWTSVDVTPQHTATVETTTTQQRDPENMTDVRPDTAQAVAPPDTEGAESEAQQKPTDTTTDLTALWEVVRWVGIGLLAALVLFGPFLLILIAKAVRRGRRRTDPDAAAAIAGGWEEYVDTAVDTGKPAPGARTRTEVAEAYATPHAHRLATLADEAVFSGAESGQDDAAEFWSIVAGERKALKSEVGWWRRVRSALSLTSFTRHLTRRASRKASPVRGRRAERRQRRPGDA